MSKHATVQRDGYEVPLIGIPQDAVIDECDCCGMLVGLTAGYWTGEELLCERCRKKTEVQV